MSWKEGAELPLLEDHQERVGLKRRLYRLIPRKLRQQWEFDPLYQRPARWCPEEEYPLIARIFFVHVGSLVWLGYNKTLQPGDVWDLTARNKSIPCAEHFTRCLNETKTPEQPAGSVGRAMWKHHMPVFFQAVFLRLGQNTMSFLGPTIVEQLLLFLRRPGQTPLVGLGLSAAMFFGSIVETLCFNQYFQRVSFIALQNKAALLDMLYQKSLRISGATKGRIGVGRIVNLQSNDAAKLMNIARDLIWIVSGPFSILTVMALLIRILGIFPALAGLAVSALLIPISTTISKYTKRIRRDLVRFTDARVRMTTEVIMGIKAIKLYAWEDPYVDRIIELREAELGQIRKAALMTTFNNIVFLGGPVLVALAAFATFAGLGNDLTAEVAFPALSLFQLLRNPLMQFPDAITSLIQSRVALTRIQKFMEEEEQEQHPPLPRAEPGGIAMCIAKGTFAWGPDTENVLRDVNLVVPEGKLVMVVGEVGSGKTSLISALLGEMHTTAGTVEVRGSTAYTAQDPWIQNASLRDNVTMGAPFDEPKYRRVVSRCAMLPDIAMLPAGDMTEIGEKGVNLSGGQRHRVALARACYQSSDIYLLDDPLSAVDAHVGRQLFDQVICGELAGTTRLLVTHQVQYIAGADYVAVVKDSTIAEFGTYEELLAKGVDFAQYTAHVEEESEDEVGMEAAMDAALALPDGEGPSESSGSDLSDSGSASEEDDAVHDSPASRAKGKQRASLDKPLLKKGAEVVSFNISEAKKKKDTEKGKIVKIEERSVGKVEKRVYVAYLGAWGPCFIMPVAMILGAVAERGLQQVQNFWLSIWTNSIAAAQAAGVSTQNIFYLQIYFVFGLSSLVFQFTRQIILVFGSTNAARGLHKRLLATVVRLPMSFFDSQPTGRLLNRFSRDTESVDITVAQSFNQMLNCLVTVSAAAVVLAAVTPYILLAGLPLAFFYYWVQKLYIMTSRELKRLDSLAFSPIFGNFNETLTGLVTLRAFRVQPMFLAKNFELIDGSNRIYWCMMMTARWLSVRLELLGSSVVFATAIFVAVLLRRSAGLAGLALTSALQLTSLMSQLVRQSTELEVSMNGVERMVEYTALEPERAAIVPGNRPPQDWPTKGAIAVEGLWLRYRPELDPVLKGLTFSVNGREKVGVAGRTGCGKSTLMLTLYRLVEPSGGRILIDGVDITQIGTFDLRSRLALVPQDPVIFSGSVRANLDPFDVCGGDDNIWQALRQAGMDGTIKTMEGGLDAVISEGGGNLSTGQRQLLCMARALLRRSRILVLDEATSNVDNTTDSLIQSTIRTAFRDCTVLTIAHRLHTIIDSDRVLVLEAGELLEFDTPENLMKNPTSAFFKLVEQTAAAQSKN